MVEFEDALKAVEKNSSGSRPKELFEDVLEEVEEAFQKERGLLKEAKLDLQPETSFTDFMAAVDGHEEGKLAGISETHRCCLTCCPGSIVHSNGLLHVAGGSSAGKSSLCMFNKICFVRGFKRCLQTERALFCIDVMINSSLSLQLGLAGGMGRPQAHLSDARCSSTRRAHHG